MVMLDNVKYEKVFLGECQGVGLQRRGPNDPEVMIVLLAGDDGNWFISGNSFCSFWLADCISVLQEAQAWIETHCEKHEYGYKFKP